MEHTLRFIEKAHQGDKAARERLVEENMGLVYSVVRRFCGRGVEKEDLCQIGCIGLLKAIDHFDLTYDVKFSTYAVPLIVGEIKRFFRDDGMLKVSRTMKENAARTALAREQLEKKLRREPTLEEISEEIGISVEEIVLAMEASAEVESLQKVVYQSDGNDICLLDRLEEKENENEKLLDRMVLETVLQNLDDKEKRLICMRYFDNLTQSEAGKILGMSQVQISRMEKKILMNIRKKLEQV